MGKICLRYDRAITIQRSRGLVKEEYLVIILGSFLAQLSFAQNEL